MNDLVKIKEYDVPPDDGRSLYVTVPVMWLRDHAQPGEKIGLFQEPGSNRLIIQKLQAENPA